MRSFSKTRTLRSLLLGGLVAMLSWPLAANAQTVRIVWGMGGLDQLSGGMLGGPNDCTQIPCDTIAHAISQAVAGDTVRLENGPFSECNIVINKDVTISGKAGRVRIDAGGQCRHFDIATAWTPTVTIANVELINGFATEGGAIRNGSGGTLTLTNVRVADNEATNGGGIFNAGGVVTVTQSDLESNFADVEGGAIFSEGGAVTITNSDVLDNIASITGGALSGSFASVTINGGATVSDNSANVGGGISLLGGSLLMSGSSLDGNTADSGGGIFNMAGTVTITASGSANNEAALDGGAVYNDSEGSVTIITSSYTGNSAEEHGGAIANVLSGTLTVRESVFDNNSALRGGAIFDDTNSPTTTIIRRSAFVDNWATLVGGALHYDGATGGRMHVINTTLSGNTADFGAAVSNTGTGTLAMANDTLYGNTANTLGAIYNNNNVVPVLLDNTIITASGGADCFNDLVSSPTARIRGLHNLSDNCGLGGAFNLGPVTGLNTNLLYYGTFPVHRLEIGSNAIDQGANGCPDPDPTRGLLDFDERGVLRPMDGDGNGTAVCDIGAYELVRPTVAGSYSGGSTIDSLLP